MTRIGLHKEQKRQDWDHKDEASSSIMCSRVFLRSQSCLVLSAIFPFEIPEFLLVHVHVYTCMLSADCFSVHYEYSKAFYHGF